MARRKRDYKKLIIRGGSIALLTLITFYFARGAVRMYGRYSEATTESRAAQSELMDLETRKAALEKDTNRLSSQRGLEEELRKRYGVALPGEGVIELSQSEATTSTAKPSLVRRWLNWFF